MYTPLLASMEKAGLFCNSVMSFCSISICILARMVLNRSDTGSQRYTCT